MSVEQLKSTSGPNLGVWREWRSMPGMKTLEEGYSRNEPRLLWLGCPGPDGKDGQRLPRRAAVLAKAATAAAAEPAKDGWIQALDRGYSAALNELSRAEADARSAKEDAAKAAQSATRAADAAEQAAAGAADVGERLDRHEQAAEQAMAELPAIADRLREIADMLRHGDAFVRKVGDFAPPERPVSPDAP